MIGDELFVSACFADEGPTLKRWRPRARGRATRIRKRTCHVTLIVSRLPDRELQTRRARTAQGVTGDRRRRRAGGAEPTEQRGRPTRRPVENRGTPAASAAVEPEEASVEELLAEPEEPTTTEAHVADETGTVEPQATVPEEELE